MVSNLTRKNSTASRTFNSGRLLAVLAVVNLALVLFDLSYISFRDAYLQIVPNLTKRYDPIKGIQPQPETEHYLKQIQELENQLSTTGLSSQQTENKLAELRRLSLYLTEGSSFASKSRTLATIENKIQQRTEQISAYDAFATFWSQPYLSHAGWQQEIAFWNEQIQPLMQTNYYRSVNRWGRSPDYFWLLDLPFVIIFAIDLITRVLSIKRHHPHLRWLDAILRRWYDLLWLLPFWRWLRVIPVSFRLYNKRLINLEPIQAQIQREFVIGFAADLTAMVGIHAINQIQTAVGRGEAIDWLSQSISGSQSNRFREEIGTITNRLVYASLHEVLPQLQPDIQALLRQGIANTLNQASLYHRLRKFPGLRQLSDRLARHLAESLSQLAYSSISNSIADPKMTQIADRLSKRFRNALEAELSKQQRSQEIQRLIIDVLEKIKLSYVREIAAIGIEQLVDEVEQLHRTHK
jgi:hypothetical protein